MRASEHIPNTPVEGLVESDQSVVATAGSRPLFVVALGASAGGLEALEKFFDNMPVDSGLAFVVVQHLSPDFKSLMDELLARHTKLAIHRVTDGMTIEANSIYLIPPKKEMIVSGGKLLLTDKDPSQGLSLPIDTFLRSLANDFGRNAIAVILSGTGSDGSRGIRAIHEAGGFVLVQDEASANFDGMPRSAIETGVVDAVLPPPEMAAAIRRHVHGMTEELADLDVDGAPLSESGIDEIFRALRDAYAIDFSLYKPNTVARRVERRMQLTGAVDLDAYVARLRHDGDELNALYRDLLIGVTRFFRDEDAFQLLESEVIPQMLGHVPVDEELRVWVAGCATGEEAYSIAILIHEAMSDRRRPIRAKIFATDVHQASLEAASAGVYCEDALSGVSTNRLIRYFVKQHGGYQVNQELRKMIVFAPHNVVKDAPFTKLDLVCCRNLLIYLQPPAQKKAISLFHFSLKTGGVLFLGPSETAGELADEFETIDSHWKIFRKRRDVRLPTDLRLPLSTGLPRWRTVASASGMVDGRHALPDVQLLRAYDALLAKYVPPSLLVNERYELVHAFAGAGRYLAFPDGRPSEDVLDLVHKELRLPLAGALQRAAKDRQPVHYGRLPLSMLADDEQLSLSIKPVSIQTSGDTYFLISFEPLAKKSPAAREDESIDLGQASREHLADVEAELRYTKENLQATIEELETTNEELQATNEELVASNEELQSTNEELHSVNEELYTVNAEHQRKITELTELTDDMDNLMRSTEIGTIFLDRALRIRKFTPQIVHAFQVMPQDIGRSIEAFSPSIDHVTLIDDLQRVLETGDAFQRNVQDRNGNWFLLRVLPYRAKGQIDGVVMTLVDIGQLKQTEAELRRMSKVFMDGADPIIIEDLAGIIVDLNREAEHAYGWPREELLGKNVLTLVPAVFHAASLELRERCKNAEHVRNVETQRRDRLGKRHTILLTLSLLTNEHGEPIGIATLSKDIDIQKQAEKAATEAVLRRDEFLAMLSHELRNPLGAVLNAAQLLSHERASWESVNMAADVIQRQGRQMARLLDDLLDVARVTQGKIGIRKQVVDLAVLLEDAVEAVRPEIDGRRHKLDIDICEQPLFVEGDAARLLQIQENLLVNAAKYTPPGGRIRVRLARENDDAVIAVEDNGQGIMPEMLTAIFDLFVQEKRSLARTEGGMGIGLSLVKLLVELHGGSVSVASEGRGKGSTFVVRLPLTTKRPENPPALIMPRSKGKRVVVVEDNADSRTTLENLLRFDGFEVVTAADGVAGLEAIRREQPDVALLDIGIPGMSGYELAKQVRAEFDSRPIRLVALTGYGRAEDHASVMAAGFDDHLVKPVGRDDLLQALRK